MSEYGRRAVHASGVGMPTIYLLDIVNWTQLRYFMLIVTAIVFTLEGLRLGVGFEHWLYDEVTREYEQHAVAGYALYMLSMTAVAVLFAPVVTIPAMLMLIIADPISGMLGENAEDEHKRLAVDVWALRAARRPVYLRRRRRDGRDRRRDRRRRVRRGRRRHQTDCCWRRRRRQPHHPAGCDHRDRRHVPVVRRRHRRDDHMNRHQPRQSEWITRQR